MKEVIEFEYKNTKFKINENIKETLCKYKQTGSRSETGGMLVGSTSINEKIIEINDLTEQIEQDKATRYTFLRSNEHNYILNQKWIESNFKKMYLGEWHTHPQIKPMPSMQDEKNWRYLLKNSVTETKFLIFIIIGIEYLEIWIGDKENIQIEWGCSYKYEDIREVN